MTMALPVVYAGNMPSLPVELAPVLFVDDAKLSSGARALLAQNGFVVVPEGAEQFSDAYREFEADWQTVPDSFDWAKAGAGSLPLRASPALLTAAAFRNERRLIL